MKAGKFILIALLAASTLFSGLAPTAYARRGNKVVHIKLSKKNQGPYGGKYLAPKKQKPVKDRYRSPVSGNILYGKPVKRDKVKHY